MSRIRVFVFFGVIALSLVFTQVIVHVSTSQQRKLFEVVNIAGRQRYRSSSILADTRMLYYGPAGDSRETQLRWNIGENLRLMTEAEAAIGRYEMSGASEVLED